MAYYVISNGIYKGIVKGMTLTQKKLRQLNKDEKDTMNYGITDVYNKLSDVPDYLKEHITTE